MVTIALATLGLIVAIGFAICAHNELNLTKRQYHREMAELMVELGDLEAAHKHVKQSQELREKFIRW